MLSTSHLGAKKVSQKERRNLIFITIGIVFLLVVMLIGGVMFLAAIYFVSKLIRK